MEHAQVFLQATHREKKHPTPLLIENSLLLLPLLVLASIAALILSYIIPKIWRAASRLFKRRKTGYGPIALDDDDDEDGAAPPVHLPSSGLVGDFRAHIRSFRETGSVLFVLEIIRTLCLVALLVLSVHAALQAEAATISVKDDGGVEAWKKHKKKKHKGHRKGGLWEELSSLVVGEFGACAFYSYTLIFSFLLLSLRPATPLRRHIIAHLDILLILGWALYAYRDLWPLLTTYLMPVDLDNTTTWARVAILSVAAVVLPLIRPRTHVPVDPLNPVSPEHVHPEQTAPWLFYVFYEFMTPLVWKAWKSPSLPYEDLHPLADYDASDVLCQKYVRRLDVYRRDQQGKPRRHMFWLLLWAFKRDFAIASVMSVISGVIELAGPVGIQQLLEYLTVDGEGQSYRPIVWIALLFIGPTIGSLAIQFYIFTMTRVLVRSESILTHLLFDHSLRLRMKDAVPDTEPKRIDVGVPTIVVGDESANLAERNMVGAQTPPEPAEAQEVAEAKADQGTATQGIAGKINVLMGSDVVAVGEGRDVALIFVYCPVQLAACGVFLYRILSWSALVGVAVMIITLPIPSLLTKISADLQAEKMAATDARVDVITEAVGALKMLKMFAWEDRIKERISVKREVELNVIWKRRIVALINTIINLILPVIIMGVTFAVFTLVEKKELTAAIVFSSMTVFELVKGQMMMCFYLLNSIIQAYVSLNRIDEFLKQSETIDEFSPATAEPVSSPDLTEAKEEGLIRFKNATFSWGSDFKLSLPDVTFAKNGINLITGPTGCGKSSLLKALIGELHFEPSLSGPSFFHLPRTKGVSYAAQESWCMSDSIKENIVFGDPFDADRYAAVIRDCGLEPDLRMLDDGDETEIGEKGVTLSGGQKARVTLARAVYARSAVVLLDDIFSALDTLTSRWIIDHLFKGDLMRDRTVLLITHHVALVAPMADYVLALNEDGSVRSAGAIDEVSLASDDDDTVEVTAEIKEMQAPEKRDKQKLVKDEEKAEGRISKRAMISFFLNFGGPVFWFTYFALLLGGQLLNAFETYWLGLWARAYETPGEVNVVYWLGMYFVWVSAGVIASSVAAIIFYLGAVRACRQIHKKLVDCIFAAYVRFLDITPVGRIVSRFTKDMKSIDGTFTETFESVADVSLGLLVKFFAVVTVVPFFSIPAIIIGILGGVLGELYIHGQLSVKREMSNAKSPLFSHFAAAVNGIVSIRAFGAQDKLRAEARRKADKYTRTATAFYNLNRWVTVRIDMLGGLFAALLAAFLIYGPRRDSSSAGFALSQAIVFSSNILWWVRMVNELEVEGNSVERIEDYMVIDQEPSAVAEKQPAAAWPTSGEIELQGLCARYSSDGPTVLDHLAVTIKSGEKVGIVGRTGSGKSTLALALLRMIPTSGSVRIDGVRTEGINLHALRSAVTIIPQDPILLSGSLRFNLDPFGDHDDAILNDALNASGLGTIRGAGGSGSATPMRLTLDSPIAAAGGNLSQGQRQLVALARALVRGTKVMILDEATASVDFETDALIQTSIRNLPSHTTVLTVAHRLETVMDYDKIMVLGQGKLLEFDSPKNLKEKEGSYFAKLVSAMEG